MRFFGLYFGFFCFTFSYIFKNDASASAIFASNILFSYFTLTSAITLSFALVAFLALKKGLKLAVVSSLFSGLFKGAAGLFFATLLANRVSLLFGSYLLSLSAESLDLYEAIIGTVFLWLGYMVFRPFDFNFLATDNMKKKHKANVSQEDVTTIDAEVIEEFKKLEKR